MNNSINFLTEQEKKYPELSLPLRSLSDLFRNKSYHQFSIKLLEIIKLPVLSNTETFGPFLISLYENVVKPVERYLNMVNLVHFVIFVSNTLETYEKAIQFLDSIQPVISSNEDSNLILKLAKIELKIKFNKNFSEIKVLTPIITDKYKTFNHGVYYYYYKNLLCYYKFKNNSNKYYNAVISFLSYIKMEEIEENHLIELAIDVCSAILVNDVFDFEEILTKHKLLDILINTEHNYLSAIVHALNKGNYVEFDQIFKSNINVNKTFLNDEEVIYKKLRLMCLVLEISKNNVRNTNIKQFNKIITFDRIHSVCQLDSDVNTELLIMDALNLNIIKGKIDGLKRELKVEWVAPRMLSNEKIKELSDLTNGWYNDFCQVAKGLNEVSL